MMNASTYGMGATLQAHTHTENRISPTPTFSRSSPRTTVRRLPKGKYKFLSTHSQISARRPPNPPDTQRKPHPAPMMSQQDSPPHKRSPFTHHDHVSNRSSPQLGTKSTQKREKWCNQLEELRNNSGSRLRETNMAANLQAHVLHALTR